MHSQWRLAFECRGYTELGCSSGLPRISNIYSSLGHSLQHAQPQSHTAAVRHCEETCWVCLPVSHVK